MSKYGLLMITAVAAIGMLVATSGADDGLVSGGDTHAGLMTGGTLPATFPNGTYSCPDCPRLYDNTSVCTVKLQALAVGGNTPNPLSVRDFFETTGGTLAGFDLYVVNAKTQLQTGETTLDQHLEIQFYTGTDDQFLGNSMGLPGLFRTIGGPSLSRIPPFFEPNTGDPGLIRVSVDYVNSTYNVVGIYEDPPNSGNQIEVQLNPVDQFIGAPGQLGRSPITLPSGKIGINIRLTAEFSLCHPQGNPKAGVVLASGGTGNTDQLHVVALDYSNGSGTNCAPAEYSEMCDDSGWQPFTNVSCETDEDCEEVFGEGAECSALVCEQQAVIPCTGGDVCNLDLPYYGAALTLYAGPGEDLGGNNDIASADDLAAPAANSETIVSVTGFIGDNGTSIGVGTPFDLYDHDENEIVGLLDWRHFQACNNDLASDMVDGVECGVHDLTEDGQVTTDDYENFEVCTGPTGQSADCEGEIPPPPIPLQDADIFRITGVGVGDVVAILLEGAKNASGVPLWDPFLRVFDANGEQISIFDGTGGESDDYERSSLDGYSTVEVQTGTSLYVGVSSSSQITKLGAACETNQNCVDIYGAGAICGENEVGICAVPCTMDEDCEAEFGVGAACGNMAAGFCDPRIWYDPTDPATIPIITNGSDAGSYTLSVAVTDNSGDSDPDGATSDFDCEVDDHEPDDSIAEADARGPIPTTIIVGGIGDGEFAHLGQDFDLYRVELDNSPLPSTSNTRSVTAQVVPVVGQGFQSVFDLAMGLYDSTGRLIATGDQASFQGALDHTRPQLGANICGSSLTGGSCPGVESPTPGLFYLGIFGTDRDSFDNSDQPFFPATPPTLLSFPHGTTLAATSCSDIRPIIGGRVNRPGDRIVGRTPPNPNTDPQNTPTNQCYRINMSTSQSILSNTGAFDTDDSLGTGNDSIPDASAINVADRLSAANTIIRVLGNGPYGGFQGDVDFYNVNASPGQIVSLNVADRFPFDTGTNNRIRSYLAWYDQDGFPFALHDYSLERFVSGSDFPFIDDDTVDELAANVVAVVPTITGAGNPVTGVVAMVGIDNGNMLQRENTPLDADRAGTTLSRRFETSILTAREYDIGVSVMDPLSEAAVNDRVFAVARRGDDAFHTEPYIGNPTTGGPESYPPLLEIDPNTGVVTNVLRTTFFNTFRAPLGSCLVPEGCPTAVSSNPLIAYDGEFLWVALETCVAGAGTPCDSLNRPLYKMNPNLSTGEAGYVVNVGNIVAVPSSINTRFVGMVEIDGWLYAFDRVTNRLRFWDKNLAPNGLNGDEHPIDNEGTQDTMVTVYSGTDEDATDFDDLDGDMATDGTHLFLSCFNGGVNLGLCMFEVDLDTSGEDPVLSLTFEGLFEDPITNESLDPGPRLGGVDVLDDGRMVTSDQNSAIVEYCDMDLDPEVRECSTIEAIALPREFQIHRLSARTEAP